MITLTPAYGRDYMNKAAALEDFNGDKDFILNDLGHPGDGRYVNKPQLLEDGEAEVKIRFGSLRQVFVVKVEP